MGDIQIEIDYDYDSEAYLAYKYLFKFLKKSRIIKVDYWLIDKVDLNDMVCS